MWCPLGHDKRHLPAKQIFIAVRLIPILTHLSSGWTVPLIQTGIQYATDDSFSECILCKDLIFEYYSQYMQINIWCWLLIVPNIQSVKYTLALYGFLTYFVWSRMVDNNFQFNLFILVESLTAFREDQFVNPNGEERWHKGLKNNQEKN